MKNETAILGVFLVLALAALAGGAPAEDPPAGDGGTLDVHDHLSGRLRSTDDWDGAARAAVAEMDRLGIRRMLILPPPQPPEMRNGYRLEDFLPAIARHPGRFAVLGGGGTLNVMIQQAVAAGKTDPELRRSFEQRAREILALGAVGFGEMTAGHLSLNPQHPYLAAPPDHPLFLLLAEIAGRNGVPIDLHMEAVVETTSLPRRFRSPPNPATLEPNLPAFERLLRHDRKAAIIWDHAGWDNTGQRTAALSAALLERHPNLYLSLRLVPRRPPAEEPSIAHNRVADERGKIRPEWLEVLRQHPDRFLIGSDEFFLSPRMRQPQHPSTGSAEATVGLLSQLPADLARRIGYENARRLFKLDG